MRHPFDGINEPCTENLATENEPSTRRSVLARTLASAACIATLFLGRGASAQRYFDQRRRPPTTTALGEEGGRVVTTYALSEEGGGPVTTFALGEEGAGRMTTYALGEEGGGHVPHPRRGGWGNHRGPRR